MRAIRTHQFGEPEVLRLEEVTAPVPQAGEVFVRVKAAGVNPVDTYVRAGLYGPRSFPFIPGSDAAGIVEKVGSGVSRFHEGDRVYVYAAACYAEGVVAPESRVHSLPDGASFAQG